MAARAEREPERGTDAHPRRLLPDAGLGSPDDGELDRIVIVSRTSTTPCWVAHGSWPCIPASPS